MAFSVPCGMRSTIIIGCLVLASCTEPFTAADEQAIRAVLIEQEAAWDRGDINGFMSGYANDICFISERGTTCGKAAVTANYQKSYPDKAAMGDLGFTVHEVFGAGEDHAWVAGLWKLTRTADTLDGGFSLLWVRRGDDWRIVRDHSY